MGSDKVNTIKNARSYKVGYEYLLAYKLTVPICDYTIEMCTVAIKINKLIKNIKNIFSHPDFNYFTFFLSSFPLILLSFSFSLNVLPSILLLLL